MVGLLAPCHTAGSCAHVMHNKALWSVHSYLPRTATVTDMTCGMTGVSCTKGNTWETTKAAHSSKHIFGVANISCMVHQYNTMPCPYSCLYNRCMLACGCHGTAVPFYRQLGNDTHATRLAAPNYGQHAQQLQEQEELRQRCDLGSIFIHKICRNSYRAICARPKQSCKAFESCTII